MIETEIDPFNKDVVGIATKFAGCRDPVRCAFDYVRSNIGDAPNAFTSIVNAMGNMGKPYVAYTSNIGGRILNEVYDCDTGEEYTANLSDGTFEKDTVPTVGYLDPISTSEQSLLTDILPAVFGIFVGALTGYAVARR